jgi:hypothetical protein
VLEDTLRDRTRSENIRGHLEPENMVEGIRQYQRNWKEQAERMTPERLSCQVYHYNPVGRSYLSD